jgi:hypothetical protein
MSPDDSYAATNQVARLHQSSRTVCKSRVQRPHGRFIRQPIRVHDGAVVAPSGLAIDQQITAAMPAYVAERDGRDGLALTWRHDTYTGGSAAGANYSITSSARASREGGTSGPSAVAVLRLMTSSCLVGVPARSV